MSWLSDNVMDTLDLNSHFTPSNRVLLPCSIWWTPWGSCSSFCSMSGSVTPRYTVYSSTIKPCHMTILWLPYDVTWPTSSEWIQLWAPIPKFEQERRQDSFPEHSSSSSQIWPEPDPKLHAEEVILDKNQFWWTVQLSVYFTTDCYKVDHYHEVYSLLLVVCCLPTNTLNMDYRRIGWYANGVAIELAMQLS